MRLPNGSRAILDVEKLRDCCLSPEHPRGRHKARIFKALLGLERKDAELLREAILEAAASHHAKERESDTFGRRFEVDATISGPSGKATIRTAWILRRGEDRPRFTTCYIVSRETSS